MTRETG